MLSRKLVQRVDGFDLFIFQQLRINCRCYIFATAHRALGFNVKYIFSAGKIKEKFYEADVVVYF